ncbi:ribonuclease J [Chromatocurvus halotolerans]|uniref:Ribonuclease J n=1 Tax=Chromatocurvus halotolerans TaxID=1132028 RepID=A0A4R2KZ99_9GAMM|nr:ribonuclease J [Chromatocurvus halotolerans]TCO78522.1 ribonuclease J [Chromatocurvus halotolerans]
MTPGPDDLWFLPLGGCGEIGMNLNLYGHDGRWLMIDCGITFERLSAGAMQIQMADPAFIVARRDLLCGLVITHAHEDHVGAVARLWPQLRCPVYTTGFTAEILRRKLLEAGLTDAVPLHIVLPGDTSALGPFRVEWVNLTHSTPESQALVIGCAAGNVFHTGDWKLDGDPVVGARYPRCRYRALADESILAMVCDSTNALIEGHSRTEGSLYAGLQRVVCESAGRVVVACFGSNIARLHTLVQVAAATERRAAILGRSLGNYFRAARTAGLWDAQLRLIDSAHLGYLPRSEVMAIATGSQGEKGAALDRLAGGSHPDMVLEEGDTVIFSSRVISGNEEAVAALVRRLHELGVIVVQDGDGPEALHASGHPCRDELAQMYRWVQPRIAIPVHGEPDHMAANAQLARAVGVPRQIVGRNGDLFMLAPVPGIRRGAVPVGRLRHGAR